MPPPDVIILPPQPGQTSWVDSFGNTHWSAPNASAEEPATTGAGQEDVGRSDAVEPVASQQQGRMCTTCGTINTENRCPVCGTQLVDDP